jgi:hypothetical protein
MTEPCSDLPPQGSDPIARAIEEAEIAEVQPIGPITGTPPPIILLGAKNGVYYFISDAGELRAFAAKDLGKLNIGSIFDGDIQWLHDNFPVSSKKPIERHTFHADDAAFWLMRNSRGKNFDPETPIRRMGVWRARKHIIAHLGSSIWYRGEKQKPGCVIDGAIYPACNDLEEPDFSKPADRFDAQRLRQNLNAWNFAQDFDADLLFGYLGAALLGSFPQWRVHALVTAERGTGKSTLARYLMDIIGAQGTSLNEYTEAGVRQKLANESRTLHLDEGESGNEEQAHRMHKVIGLLRKMSDGAGAQIVRGTSSGTALNSVVTGCVFMTAINAPPLQPQDKSRILSISLDRLDGRHSSEDILLFREEARALSPRLRARALIGANRFVTTFNLYRSCLIEHGCDARQSDLFATLCAGRSLMLDDETPPREIAVQYVSGLRDRLRLIMIDDSEASDGQSCLNRLLDAECAAIRDGIRRSIGQLVAEGIGPGQPENDKLIPLGIRVIETRESKGAERMLFVANDHLGLKRIFHNTPWADGNWRASLRRLPGVMPSPRPVNINRKARGLLIPKALLPSKDEGNEVDISPYPPDPAPQ